MAFRRGRKAGIIATRAEVEAAVAVALAEKERGEAPGPSFRGAALEAQGLEDHEWILAGPAETGKTWAAMWRLDSLCRATPGAKAALIRKVRADMAGTVLETLERVQAIRGGVAKSGGAHVETYDYPNGSRIYVGGMDRAEKVLSGERDWIVVNQAEELSLEDWETLSTRCTGRGCVTSHPAIFGDCNPGPPSHWILHRASLRVLHSRHEDNPTLYDDRGRLTPQGERTMGILDGLTGVRLERLRYGRWVAAEGIVYDGWDRRLHVVPRFEVPASWRRIGAIDFGYTNPAVLQLWAIDPDGRMYLEREIYRSQTLVADLAEQWKAMTRGLTVEAVLADHDAEDRATLHRAGVPTRAAVKEVQAGIQKVAARLRVAGDGKPRLFLLEGALVERDSSLAASHRPTCTLDEIEGYVWAKSPDGRPVKEEPEKINDHGLDALRYAVEYVDRSSAPEAPLLERVRARVDGLGIQPMDITARNMAFEREKALELRKSSPPPFMPTTMGRLRFRR